MDALKSLQKITTPNKETKYEFLHRLSTPKSSVRDASFSPEHAARSKSAIQSSLVVEGRKLRPCSVAVIDSKLRYAEKFFESQVATCSTSEVSPNSINGNTVQGFNRLSRIGLMKKTGVIEPEVVHELVHHIKKEYGICVEESESDNSLDNDDSFKGASGK